jgi:predicted RNase H-like HicB family nuclease
MLSMTMYYPIVIETEKSGAMSAYVPGLPVFAAADTRRKAEQAIRETLAAYLEAHPESVPTSHVRVARVSDAQRAKVHIVGVGALLGTGRSSRKARASQMNGRLGGRPRKTA